MGGEWAGVGGRGAIRAGTEQERLEYQIVSEVN